MRKHLTRVTLLVGVAALAATAWAAAGSARPFSGNVSGTLTADGSSTVGPFATAAAETFQRANSGAQRHRRHLRHRRRLRALLQG